MEKYITVFFKLMFASTMTFVCIFFYGFTNEAASEKKADFSGLKNASRNMAFLLQKNENVQGERKKNDVFADAVKAVEKEIKKKIKTTEALQTKNFPTRSNDRYENEIINDEVSVGQSATDEMVFYDYKNVTKNSPEKTFDGKISKTVQAAIERELGKKQRSKISEQERMPEKALDKSESFLEINEIKISPREFLIHAKEINIHRLKKEKLINFEFVPDYDREERIFDEGSGEVKLQYSLAKNTGTQTGVLQAVGLIPTRVELNLSEEQIEVPLLNEEGIQKFLERKKTDVHGNLLLVAMNQQIQDVEIDSEYQYKLYLSERFKLMEGIEGASYVFFMGVKTGNLMLKYLLENKTSTQKIIYIGEGEMFYDSPSFKNDDASWEVYTLTTRSLLGKTVKELNIDGDDVSLFGTKKFAKKRALNAYELKMPTMVSGARNYLELNHLSKALFVGTAEDTDLEIPSIGFIEKALEVNDLKEMGTHCLLQINIEKDPAHIRAAGKNKNGEMYLETSFLDRDGNFSRENSERSEKIFVTGEMEGLFGVRIDYTDGTSDFLKTFCSEGSYLMEQL